MTQQVKTKRTIRHATNVIQIGDITHHHDQLITPHNFKVTNTIVSRPKKPMPLELDD